MRFKAKFPYKTAFSPPAIVDPTDAIVEAVPIK